MSKIPAISVFFPAYNEEKNIKSAVTKVLAILPRISEKFEIIVVNDGSTDKTAEIVKEIASKNPDVKLISHKINKGYGASLATGFYSACYPLIGFCDSDGQFVFEEIKNFLPYIESADLIIGYRKKRAEGFVRKLNGKAWTTLIRVLFGLKVHDLDCGFKLVKKEVIDKIPRLESEGAMISAELLVKAQKMGFKIAEVPVSHHPRRAGIQTGANLKVISRAFLELFKLYPKLQKLHA
jgi:glycosyltransferase involved in cell wall biosynthesis